MLAGLCGLCVGTYAVLDRTAPRVLALPMLAVGAAVALTGLVGAGSRVTRSRYRPDTVAAAGVAGARVGRGRGRASPWSPGATCWRRTPPSTPGRSSRPPTCSWPAWPWRAGLAAPVPVRAEAPVALPVVAAR